MNGETYRTIPCYWCNYGYYCPIDSLGQFRQPPILDPISKYHDWNIVGKQIPAQINKYQHWYTPDPINKYQQLDVIGKHVPGQISKINQWYIVQSPIEKKYQELIRRGFTGTPASAEHTVTDGVGRARAYNNGMGFWSIWWHPETGAHEVHGAIIQKWFNLGYHLFGYPITDELMTPDGRGRFNHFRDVNSPNKPEKSIYWTPQTGAHAVQGTIRNKWAELGWERSPLGYPISDEKENQGFKIQDFENGSIYVDLHDVAHVQVGPPATGSVSTPSGSTPSGSTTQPTASYSRVNIYNCHTDRRSIAIWVNDGSGWNLKTTLAAQYNDYGTCPVGEPYVLELKSGVWNYVVCVDVGAIGCGVNDPTQAACRRYEFSMLGNSNGPQYPAPVIVN